MSDNPLVDDQTEVGPGEEYETTWQYVPTVGFVPLTEGTSEYGWWQGLPPVEKGYDLGKAISEGNWGEALIAAGGGGLEVLGAALDPLGTAAGYIASWLMEHITPLRYMLDGLAGHPETIKAYSRTWGNISNHLYTVHSSFVEAAIAGTEGWTGPAGDRCRAMAGGIATMTSNCAILTGGLSKLCMAAAELVAAVRGLIRDMLAMIAGEIVAIGVELLATWGAAAPYAVEQLLVLIYRCTIRALKYLDEMYGALADIASISNTLSSVLVGITKAWKEREDSGLFED